MTFQGDLKATFEMIHERYIKSYETFINEYDFNNSINIQDASEVVFNLKQYDNNMKEIIQLFKFQDISENGEDNRENIINKELEKKMLPIMFLYRNILEVKHSVNLPA